jgi:CheY-like chemotaxis protein
VTVRIVVIEDTPELLELVGLILRTHGHTVFEAQGGLDGVKLACTERPDLVIADVEMHDIDGFEVLHRLRTDPALKQVPVLALTACAMRGDRDRILAAGFDGYLSKPIRVRELIPQLATFVPALLLPA